MPTPHPTRRRWFPAALLLIGSVGCAALWVLVATWLERPASWMAVIAAADAALMLRLAGARPGTLRSLGAVLGTGLAVVIANWFITAAMAGRMLGLAPLESALRLGRHHAWTVIELVNTPVELAWIGAALVVAAVCAR